MGFVSFFENFVQIVVLLIAWLIVLIAFFILAVQLFVTLIEFKLTTLAGFVLVPFGLFSKTAFLAERVLGNVISSGVKVLVLAVIVGIGIDLVQPVHAGFGGNQPTHRRCHGTGAGGLGAAGPWHFRSRHRQPASLPVPRSSAPARPSAPRSPRAVSGSQAQWACGAGARCVSQERSAARGRRWLG